MSVLAIPIAFCLMISILLWFVIGAKGNWIVKIAITFISIYFSIVVWFSSYTYFGWPCKDPLPLKYVVYWAQIEEPDPNSEGSIFLWIEELESKFNLNPLYSLGYYKKKEPRAYSVPYTKPLHKNVQNMLENIKKGSVYVGGEKGIGKDNNQKIDKDPLKRKGQFSFSYKSKDQYLFELPPPKIPEKIKNDN